MARSTYIYIVYYHCCLRSAFTVKHELIYSLPKSFEVYNDLYKVYRIRDGANVSSKVEDVTAQIGGEAYEV